MYLDSMRPSWERSLRTFIRGSPKAALPSKVAAPHAAIIRRSGVLASRAVASSFLPLDYFIIFNQFYKL